MNKWHIKVATFDIFDPPQFVSFSFYASLTSKMGTWVTENKEHTKGIKNKSLELDCDVVSLPFYME